MTTTPKDDVERLAWELCNAERPLDGATKFDVRPCPRHIAEAEGRKVDDGFGNVWVRCPRPDCDLHVVRPGKVQCRGDNDEKGCP